MQKLIRTALAVLAIALLAGCGGGGGASPAGFVNRLVVGYVYVTGNAGSGSPDVIVSPNSTPPSGYFVPTAGTFTISVADGEVSRAPDSEIYDMAISNAIVANVKQKKAPYQATFSASDLELEGTTKSFSSSLVDLGMPVDNGTTLAVNIGAPSYAPGPPAEISMLLRDRAGDPGTTDNPFMDPETATGGNFISGNLYDVAVAVFDEEGTAISGLTIDMTSSNPALVVMGTMQLQPVTGTGVAAGPVTIIAAVSTNSGLTGSFIGDFGYGTATTVVVTPLASTLEWEEVGGVVNSTTATALVTNEYAAPYPNGTVDWTNPSKVTATDWNAPVGGAAFDTVQNTSGNDGVTPTVTFSTPAPADGVLGSTYLFPKGVSNVTATSGAATSFAVITITRPLSALTVSGPSRVDIGTTSPGTGGQSYQLTGATDVDLEVVSVPSGAHNWAVVNSQFAANVGNTGDTSAGTTAASTIGATDGILTAGSVAGTTTVTLTIGSTVSNGIVTEVFGVPSKMFYTPDTVASSIPGARGEYAFGGVGNALNFVLSMQDSSGHDVPAGEWAGSISSATIQALTGGSITPGGVDVTSFTITSGNVDGLFTLMISGSWTGMWSGAGSINLSRDTGHNAP